MLITTISYPFGMVINSEWRTVTYMCQRWQLNSRGHTCIWYDYLDSDNADSKVIPIFVLDVKLNYYYCQFYRALNHAVHFQHVPSEYIYVPKQNDFGFAHTNNSTTLKETTTKIHIFIGSAVKWGSANIYSAHTTVASPFGVSI